MTRIVQEASKSLFHNKVRGLILVTSPELEVGIDKEVEGAIGGGRRCLQVG